MSSYDPQALPSLVYTVFGRFKKPGVPLRPIPDMTSSSYNSGICSQVDILEPVRTEIAHYSLNDTLHFVELI